MSGLFHLPYVFKIHSCSRYQNFIPFYEWIIFKYMDMPHFIYSFIWPWTLGLFTLFRYCKQCYSEQWYTGICLNTCFQFFWSGIAWSSGFSMLTLWENTKMFFTVAGHITFPPAMYCVFQFLHIIAKLVIFCVCIWVYLIITILFDEAVSQGWFVFL